jgi:hypothetical protein
MTVRRAAPVRYRWGDKLIVTVGWLLVVAAGCDVAVATFQLAAGHVPVSGEWVHTHTNFTHTSPLNPSHPSSLPLSTSSIPLHHLSHA